MLLKQFRLQGNEELIPQWSQKCLPNHRESDHAHVCDHDAHVGTSNNFHDGSA